MTEETTSPLPAVQIAEMPTPEQTLTDEQAEDVQGGNALKTIAAAETDYRTTLLLPAVQAARES